MRPEWDKYCDKIKGMNSVTSVYVKFALLIDHIYCSGGCSPLTSVVGKSGIFSPHYNSPIIIIININNKYY